MRLLNTKAGGAVLFLLALVAAGVVGALIALGLDDSGEGAQRAASAPAAFQTNQGFIAGLYTEIDLADVDAVFDYVFGALEDEILLYPTENYYYFTFPLAGRVVWGSLHLPAYRLDEGVLGFGYVAKGFDVNETDRVGGSADYSEGDGIAIAKVDDFSYSITHENKTVLFRLNQLDLEPRDGVLTADEVLVEPTFDESGLRFFLVFNEPEQRLYWVLNEEGYVPETFLEITPELVVGQRTGFAFYLDGENGRRVLVGVFGPNVMQNNWNDGPFDQLLDNYVYLGAVERQRYIEAHDPSAAGRIDRFGNYLDSEGRVAIGAYTTYFYHDDLVDLVESCSGTPTHNALLTCLTTEHHDQLLSPPYP